jgi:hypothetical protein
MPAATLDNFGILNGDGSSVTVQGPSDANATPGTVNLPNLAFPDWKPRTDVPDDPNNYVNANRVPLNIGGTVIDDAAAPQSWWAGFVRSLETGHAIDWVRASLPKDYGYQALPDSALNAIVPVGPNARQSVKVLADQNAANAPGSPTAPGKKPNWPAIGLAAVLLIIVVVKVAE